MDWWGCRGDLQTGGADVSGGWKVVAEDAEVSFGQGCQSVLWMVGAAMSCSGGYRSELRTKAQKVSCGWGCRDEL